MYKGKGLEKLLGPQNLAIYGDMPLQGKIFGRCLSFLQISAFQGNIYPVTEECSEINGLKCFRDISSLPVTPDLILIDTESSSIPDIVREAGKKGIPYAIIFSPATETVIREKISAEAKVSGIRILGPNSQGLLNISGGVPLTYSMPLPLQPEPGSHVALVSQSGSLGFACFSSAREKGVKFGYLVTTGDQVDIDDLEIAEFLLQQEEINLIILYLEDIRDGRELLSFFNRARESNVTVAVLKAACYETSAFSSKYQFSGFIDEEQIWEAALSQHGVIRLRDVDEISNLASLFSLRQSPLGPRVGIISSSRGAGIMMADHCRSHQLEIPKLSVDTQQKIKEYLPLHGNCNNPVNLTSLVMEQPDLFRSTLEILLDEPTLDVVISVVTTSSKETA
ncbi:MAG TPA: CoA-binding protein, partial [Synergistales bacterium]|nr:CoA-binding protein [Synergistales bacterium]